MKKDDEKAVNFSIKKDKAMLLSVLVKKHNTTLAGLCKSFLDNYITEHKEEAEKIINALELNVSI